MEEDIIKNIKLKYCKGIYDKEFELNIKPNILNLLVAPNGFGKSSIAHTFNAINLSNGKLEPKSEDWYYRNESHYYDLATERPEFYLSDNKNTFYSNLDNGDVIEKYDIYVINSKLATETEENHQKKSSIIESKFTIEKIPFVGKKLHKVNFEDFTLNSFYEKWNITNKKIYKNHKDFLDNKDLICELDSIIETKNITMEIRNIITTINEIPSKKTAVEMLDIIASEIIPKISNPVILQLIEKCNFDNSKADALINVILFIYLTNTDTYRSALLFYKQSLEDAKIEEEINNFNTTKGSVYASYNEGGEFNFPSPEIISNGQRDILTLVTQLLMARRSITKEYGIIIIDEVFDYLDDSNIIAVQYYILKMINEFKKQHKKVYFLLFTHIDPMYYVTYRYLHTAEGLINVVYLDTKCPSSSITNEILQFKKLLKARDPSNTELNPKLNKYYFHFNSDDLEKLDFTSIFINNGLNIDWRRPINFINYCKQAMVNYLDSQDYNPFAVSNYLRYVIEKNIYEKLKDDTLKQKFIKKPETLRKIHFAIEKGIEVNPSYCLLSYIYNPYDHIENINYNDEDLHIQSETALFSKLNNLQIKKMIHDIYEE